MGSTGSTALASEILVVDDEDALCRLLAEVLTDCGFTVATFTNGADALDYLQRNAAPRVILVDLVMPIMSGTEFLERFSQMEGTAGVAVFVLTAQANPDESRLRALGASRVFAKPFPIDALLASLGAG